MFVYLYTYVNVHEPAGLKNLSLQHAAKTQLLHSSVLLLNDLGRVFLSCLCSLPRPKMMQTDLSRLINSDEIQKVVRPIE